MASFEVAKGYEDKGINLPVRATKHSAGYDFEVAQDTVVKAWVNHNLYLLDHPPVGIVEPFTLEQVSNLTKSMGNKPTLVPTGIKCRLAGDEYLQLSVRSSCPLKHWLILANGVGVIDADYYGNPDNDGAIYFQIINLSPYDIVLRKGEKIGQGIIQKYITTEIDVTEAERTGGFGSTGN